MDSDSDNDVDLENCWRFLNIHPIKILHIVVSLHHNTICFDGIYTGQSLWVVSILLETKQKWKMLFKDFENNLANGSLLANLNKSITLMLIPWNLYVRIWVNFLKNRYFANNLLI